MKLYTIYFKSKTYNPYRCYPQSMDRYAHSIGVTGGIRDVFAKIAELKGNNNIRPESLKVFDNTGKRVDINA